MSHSPLILFQLTIQIHISYDYHMLGFYITFDRFKWIPYLLGSPVKYQLFLKCLNDSYITWFSSILTVFESFDWVPYYMVLQYNISCFWNVWRSSIHDWVPYYMVLQYSISWFLFSKHFMVPQYQLSPSSAFICSINLFLSSACLILCNTKLSKSV